MQGTPAQNLNDSLWLSAVVGPAVGLLALQCCKKLQNGFLFSYFLLMFFCLTVSVA